MTHRDEIVNFLGVNWTATPILLLDDLMSLDDLPAAAQEQVQLIVDFPSATEVMQTIAVHDADGWRQSGVFQIAFANPIGRGSADVRQLCADMTRLLRGRRIGNTVIQGVPTFSADGLSDGKWQIWISLPSFYRDEFQ